MPTRIAVGVEIPALPPVPLVRALLYWARLIRLDSCLVPDHLLNFVPTALWDPKFFPAARQFPSPHAYLGWEALLGGLAGSAGRVRLGVGVTEPIRRHPVLIAQSILTLAHMLRRAPILGIGAGERLNITPYGLDFSALADRVDEALQIIRRCFTSTGPIDFHGRHFRLDGARLDLRAPAGKRPRIWVAAHGPRMLRLTGQYGDGWYPVDVDTPAEYAAKLQIVQDAARQAGRNPAAITPALQKPILVARSEQELQAMLETTMGRFAGLMAPAAEWHKRGLEHPFGADYRGSIVDLLPDRYDRETCERGLAAVPPELWGHGALCGTPAQIAETLRAFAAAGLRHIVLSPLTQVAVSARAGVYALLAIPRIAKLVREDG